MTIWENQTAIVTGGASGLGEATARKLADNGLQVAIFDMNAARGRTVAEEIGGTFHTVDVTDVDSVATAIGNISGPIRVIVNCAGIAPAAKTVSRGEAHDPALFAKTIQVNLIGSFICASQAAAAMTALDPLDDDGTRGVIVNTASVAAFDGQVGQAAYAASKGGIAGLTLPMARDLADKGVRVCAIAPGLFLTPMLEGLPEEVQTSLGTQVPFPSRLGSPSEYAKLVCHILDNPMLNGEVIRLDGAIRMAPR
ncbi:SDR family NAD(P)-dependent oxidoreductase [Yoonia sp. 208BN28-4]|uniref:SDR family NAD(P)-dependent oxidoreductase n=1 Tax=Yoonia sp. 208BN28-4 TaxID=3126505 RepID=UPI00309C07AD